MLISHQKVHTKISSDRTLSGKPKNETKTQLSPNKIDLPKEPSNIKRKITHQESVRPSKYPRHKNIIDPVDNEQFLNDIQKHENHGSICGIFTMIRPTMA